MQNDLITKIKSILIHIDHSLDNEDYLRMVAEKISEEIQMKYIVIGRLVTAEKPMIATEVFWENGCETENITYPLQAVPCANVIINRQPCLYPDGVNNIFPEYLKKKGIVSYVGAPILASNFKLIGILSMMDVNPISDKKLILSLCEFLALRIGATLELFKVAEENNPQFVKPVKNISALGKFQKNLTKYQLLAEKRRSAFTANELTEWQELHDRLKADQKKLMELLKSNSCSQYRAGIDSGSEQIINKNSEEPLQRISKAGYSPGSFEVDPIAAFLIEQNFMMLSSVKKIMGMKMSPEFDEGRLHAAGSIFDKSAAESADEKQFNNIGEMDEFLGNILKNPPNAPKGKTSFKDLHHKATAKKQREVAAAIRVLLEHNKVIEREFGSDIKFNLEKIILPDLEKLKNKLNKKEHRDLCRVITTNIVEITTPLLPSTQTNILNKLSPTELRVANLIKQGHNTKDIGQILNLSPQTVATHRRNIRKKMGLTNQKENLFTVLNQP